MDPNLPLRRKYTFTSQDRKMVFIKKPIEHHRHVIMKALLWSLYLPQYPRMRIEVSVGAKYKPDLVELDQNYFPIFWGEVGKVKDRKLRFLVDRYRTTHFAFAKWNVELAPFEKLLSRAISASSRSAPIDIIAFPVDSEERFIDHRGYVGLCLDDVKWKRLE